MDTNAIVIVINEEIRTLTHVRDLLVGRVFESDTIQPTFLKRTLPLETRKRMAAAQSARWAAARAGAPPPPRKGKRNLSPEARARISAAQKKRWASVQQTAA